MRLNPNDHHCVVGTLAVEMQSPHQYHRFFPFADSKDFKPNPSLSYAASALATGMTTFVG